MQQISLTPFGRQPVTAALVAARSLADQAPALPRIDKWALLADLRRARVRFGLTDRPLAVLCALLSFLPAKELQDQAELVVYPSNAVLCDRAHGMAESTLRRHLAQLVQSGLIWRQDSPNGKRFCRRGSHGPQAFGFDLRPLLLQAARISQAAAEVAEAEADQHRQREALVLRLRDAAKLAAYGRETGVPGDWDALETRLLPLRARLRRRMEAAALAADLDIASDILRAAKAMLVFLQEETNGTAAHSGRHLQESNKDLHESEPCPEEAGLETDVVVKDPPLPLYLVVKACPDIHPYADGRLSSWHDLVAAAGKVRGMMGISLDAWQEAQRAMGPETAAIAVSAILQRFDKIASPGGYLRSLSAKAAMGAFSPGPMVMALLRTPVVSPVRSAA